MAKSVTIVVDPSAIADFVARDQRIRQELLSVANDVKNEAQATAQSAQNGPGNTIDGYAEAGFSVEWEQRGSRPRVNIISNAPGDVALAAHFHTQKRDGVGHLRAALYKFTTRG